MSRTTAWLALSLTVKYNNCQYRGFLKNIDVFGGNGVGSDGPDSRAIGDMRYEKAVSSHIDGC